jgi:hypothetical protein
MRIKGNYEYTLWEKEQLCRVQHVRTCTCSDALALKPLVPTSGHDANQGGRGCDVGSREAFMEDSIIMKKNQNLYVSSNTMLSISLTLLIPCIVLSSVTVSSTN